MFGQITKNQNLLYDRGIINKKPKKNSTGSICQRKNLVGVKEEIFGRSKLAQKNQHPPINHRPPPSADTESVN